MGGSLQGRHVVVTGATGELGRAVAEALLDAGALCHLPCRSAAKLADLVRGSGDRARVAEGVDPTEESSIGAFYEGLGELWASIHCVGAFACGPLVESSLAEVRRMHSVNAASAYLCSRGAARVMVRTGVPGRIVNVVARQALEPRLGAGAIPYAMSKAAVAALTVGLDAELGARGILVNAVAPSVLDTPANRAAMPRADHSGWPSPGQVAATIAFLASPENETVRGAIVTAYGRE